MSRSTLSRKSVRDDQEVEDKLRALAELYPTRGIDWYYHKIRQEGLIWNRKKVLRVYRKLRLQHRRKVKKRIPSPVKEVLAQPLMPNTTWSMDFMSDALEDGRTIRILNIIDDYNRKCLAIRCGVSFPAQRVTRILDEVIELHGKPQHIRTDNGPEFISFHYEQWCQDNGIACKRIDKGKPSQNGYIERFNRTFREDILDAYIFTTLPQMQHKADLWKTHYNHEHPHQSLGGKSPLRFAWTRQQVIAAYERVKAKMNGSKEPALTRSPATIPKVVPVHSKGKS
jgi:putative transposase